MIYTALKELHYVEWFVLSWMICTTLNDLYLCWGLILVKLQVLLKNTSRPLHLMIIWEYNCTKMWTFLRSLRLKKIIRGVFREAVVQRCSVKKVFWEISQNSQKNTCARVSFLIKLQTWPAIGEVVFFVHFDSNDIYSLKSCLYMYTLKG